MHYSIITDFSITLFGFLSSLAFNNRIENLTLITKFRGAPIFRGGHICLGGGPEAVPLLPPSRAGPAYNNVVHVKLFQPVQQMFV